MKARSTTTPDTFSADSANPVNNSPADPYDSSTSDSGFFHCINSPSILAQSNRCHNALHCHLGGRGKLRPSASSTHCGEYCPKFYKKEWLQKFLNKEANAPRFSISLHRPVLSICDYLNYYYKKKKKKRGERLEECAGLRRVVGRGACNYLNSDGLFEQCGHAGQAVLHYVFGGSVVCRHVKTGSPSEIALGFWADGGASCCWWSIGFAEQL
ncbi:hypothetical protein BC938DRAFT_473131 [Jimgerdemannia flammicorona]|uniref:Uncharacterized protein n=1 Tax=Jimgerdemannia flammicorona TaxID=994334 RepID=A0A433QTH5_9FUNG|nr:hypothetical protein BC938DRAFT_473131 [Jimgerdemannia flammicorona]